MVQIAVGAAMTSLSEPAAPGAGLGCVWGWFAVADVTVSTSLLNSHHTSFPPGWSFTRLPTCFQRSALVRRETILRRLYGCGLRRDSARAPGRTGFRR